ncbi:MAG: hypothetical protein KAR45_13315, partial [Desulfobacteraceae bacterium]|nr:hypothetical protein [Desulfobacteraceae bacterium]
MEHKTRCSNAQYLIDYFINFGIPESQILTGVKKEKSFISNPHNWLPINDWHQIMSNCQKSCPHLTLDYWQKIACSIKDNETTGIWKAIAMFGGINPLYRLTTRYIKSFNTFIDLEINSIKKNAVDFSLISDPKVCSLLMVRWTTGVLQAIPCALDIPPAKTQILFDQSDLRSIIIDFYKHYDLAYQDKNGIIYVNEKPLGRHIKLKQKIEDGRQLFTNEFSNEKPYNAILITHDLIINDTHLLKKGDIFNAPYGRVLLTWSKVGKKFSFSKSPKLKEELLISFNEQLALAEERYFELERLRKKEQKQIIQLKKALNDYNKIGNAIKIDWGKRYQDRNNFEKEMFVCMIKTIEPSI